MDITNYIKPCSSLAVDGVVSEDKHKYKDPGHEKEKIYEWFEQRSIYRINQIDIK